MEKVRITLLVILFVVILAVIILTWGSIGSAVLTLALLLVLGFMALKKIMDKRDENDFTWEM